MRTRTASSLTTLALGTALATMPAFAQQSDQQSYHYPMGRNLNDGGYAVQNNGGSQTNNGGQRTGSESNRQAARPGGDVYASGSTAQPHTYPVGRSMNDGGYGQNTADANERTGSFANRQATGERRGGDVYAANGRPIYNFAPGWNNGPMNGPMGGGGAAACEARFHSFDPATGTYLGFDGRRHVCR